MFDESPTPPTGGGGRAIQQEPAGTAAFRRLLEAGADRLAAARAAQRESCRLAAVQARELAAFARLRPAAVLDRPDSEVGAAAAASRAARPAALTAVSEWAADEVAAVFGLPSAAAGQLLAESIALVEQLPATLEALAAGAISWTHARMLTEVLAPLRPADRAEVEARLLAGAAGRTEPQLRAAARRAVLHADAAAAARRLAEAIRTRQVRLFPGEDGMASLAATMTLPVARACHRALEAYARECATPGDERTLDQRMVDCLADLILRPAAGDRPPVQVQLTVVAGVPTLTGGDEPGEIDGHPVPAALVRELAHSLGLLPRPEPAEPATAETPPATTAPPPAPPPDAPTDTSTGEPHRVLAADERAAADLAALLGLRTVAGTTLAQLPAIAVIDELSGQLLALTNGAALRRTATTGHGLGPPAATAGYAPGAALDRFVRVRDRRCRFPGCRARARRCDLDHTIPWPAGTTSADNLCCLCRHHHRLSHQAPGWTIHHLPDGGLQWTTPGGQTITTHPPRYGTDDDLPPPPPVTAAERVLGRPRPPGTPDADPAPF